MSQEPPATTEPQSFSVSSFVSRIKGTWDKCVSGPKTESRTYLAALRATIPLVPVVAVLTTVAAYVALETYDGLKDYGSYSGLFAVSVGPLVAIFAWLVVALFALRSVGPCSADSRNYHMIREKVDRLGTRTAELCEGLDWPENSHDGPPNNGPGPHDDKEAISSSVRLSNSSDAQISNVDPITRSIVCKQVRNECRTINSRLEGTGGMPWVTGMGYMELWRRIHRAEEALIKVQPTTEVLGGAMRDESRLVDSTLTNKETLLERLRSAVAVLDETTNCSKLHYLAKPESNGKAADAAPAEDEQRKCWEKARTILSEVRYQINYFRDKGSEGIILARNRLVGTSVVVGVATYILLALAIFASAPANTIIAASAYFLVGALTGLFARSQTEWTADTAVGDFGLSTSRLFHVPWLSGLAAIGGVLVVSVVDKQLISHPPTTEAASIQDFFKDYYPPLFLVAAVFGLTPDLIIRRLTQQAERFKGDLQSTETGRSTKALQKTPVEGRA